MAKAFLLLFIILAPSFVFAQGIFINEIAWMGSIVGGVDPSQHWRYEWLELYNNADTVGMLNGWMLELYRDTLDFGIPLRGAISPRGYFLIGASDKIQGLDLNYKNLAGKFNNSGQKVVLKNALGEVVDEMDARSGWPAGDNLTKRTMERNLGRPGLTTQWQTSKDSGGTPRAQNSKGVEPKLSVTKEPKLQEKSQPLLLKESDPTETKKDISVSSDEESQNSTTLVALVLALGSSAATLALKKWVLRA